MADEETNQLSRKDRERERHRGEILAAAEWVFVRKGYEATTVEEIAKKAEFAVGTLYNFFKGKDELYGCVIHGIVQDFMEQFEKKVLSIGDPEEALAALIELRLTHFEAHSAFVRLVFAASPGGRMDPLRLLPPPCIEMHDRYMAAVIKLFAEGIARGIFDEADPLYLALCLEGIINAFVAYWSRNPPAKPLPERVATMRREFLGRIKLRLGGDAVGPTGAS